MTDNNNNNGLLGIGLFAFVSLIVFALIILYSKPNGNSPAPVGTVTVNQNAAPPATVIAPVVPVAPPVVVCPTPSPICDSELYNMGYKDSSSGRRRSSLYCNNIHYMRGYNDGARFCPPRLRFNINIGGHNH